LTFTGVCSDASMCPSLKGPCTHLTLNWWVQDTFSRCPVTEFYTHIISGSDFDIHTDVPAVVEGIFTAAFSRGPA
jgi:hypothetical protein